MHNLYEKRCMTYQKPTACCPLSVCQSDENCSHFHLFLSQNHWSNANQTWFKAYLKEIHFSSNKGPCSFPRRHKSKIAKTQNVSRTFKIFFSRTTGLISTRLAQNILGLKEFKFILLSTKKKIMTFNQPDCIVTGTRSIIDTAS